MTTFLRMADSVQPRHSLKGPSLVGTGVKTKEVVEYTEKVINWQLIFHFIEKRTYFSLLGAEKGPARRSIVWEALTGQIEAKKHRGDERRT